MLHHIVQSNDSTFWSSLYNTWLEKKSKLPQQKGKYSDLKESNNY